MCSRYASEMRVLVVEDDEDLASFVRRGLLEEAYAVDVARRGTEALALTADAPYDAVVLDVMIPAPDGVEVCRQLRASGSRVPILMLTARDSVDDKIDGLDAGADDYLTKPFEFRELLARLRALLRRGGAAVAPVIVAGPLRIDTRSHRVSVDGRALSLTTKEYFVLEYLARNADRIVSKEAISENVWNEELDPLTNVIEVYVNRLRRHIESVSTKKLIQTVRGSGYMLSATDE